MKLHVLIGQRKCGYPGQYGLEALSCMSSYEYDDNPDFLHEKLMEHQTGVCNEFDAMEIIDFDVNEGEITNILYPAIHTLIAEISEDQE